MLLKSVAGENRIITVSVDKEEIQGALVSIGSQLQLYIMTHRLSCMSTKAIDIINRSFWQ